MCPTISKSFQAQLGLCNNPHLSWGSVENRNSHETAGISCFSSEQKYSSRGRALLLALYLSFCLNLGSAIVHKTERKQTSKFSVTFSNPRKHSYLAFVWTAVVHPSLLFCSELGTNVPEVHVSEVDYVLFIHMLAIKL